MFFPGGTKTDIIIREIMRGRVGPVEWNIQRGGERGLLKEKYFLWGGITISWNLTH